MALSGKSSSVSDMSTLDWTEALQARRVSVIFDKRPALSAALPGTGFDTLPPRAILTNLLKFLKSLSLKLVGLGFDCIPFHFGWELVEWKPKLSDLKLHVVEVLEICDVVEVADSCEVFGHQIELDLGEESSIYDEPPVEVAGVAPTAVVEVEEESSVEVLEARASDENMGEQAVRTMDETVHKTVEERTGAEPACRYGDGNRC